MHLDSSVPWNVGSESKAFRIDHGDVSAIGAVDSPEIHNRRRVPRVLYGGSHKNKEEQVGTIEDDCTEKNGESNKDKTQATWTSCHAMQRRMPGLGHDDQGDLQLQWTCITRVPRRRLRHET